jgi:copper(I)-binding protein
MGAEGALPGATSAVYLEIRNGSSMEDRLLGGDTPVAGGVEVHESRLEGEVMRMRRVEAVALPGGETVALKPGGLHIMLLDLRRSLEVGDTLSLALTFLRSPPVLVKVPVRDGGEG